ncbi:hypothetical protein OPT61_g10696 [Boeremia exigua]|uniref:Uncharacterized protein n=1 Tax=Boeremia exigua TaxID=749465 RepID=A0ACC2HPV1_9PLEO|nr:hypothetical protein OPT61_g10696 [Boeremia exigua]
MTTLLSLPTELLREILNGLQPTTTPFQTDLPEEQRWDFRHWTRTLLAVAQTCSLLRDIAVPLLYTRYEAPFSSPIFHLIDHSVNGSPLLRDLRHVAVRPDFDDSQEYYRCTEERKVQYLEWAKGTELASFGVKETNYFGPTIAGKLEMWRLVSRAPNLESLATAVTYGPGVVGAWPISLPMWFSPVMSVIREMPANPYHGWYQRLHSLDLLIEGRFSMWMAEALSLPSLRSLCLREVGMPLIEDLPTLVWPEAKALSGVRDISFVEASLSADIVIGMTDRCKAIESFMFQASYSSVAWQPASRKQDSTQTADGPGRIWKTDTNVFTGSRHSMLSKRSRCPGMLSWAAHQPWKPSWARE